MKVFIRHPKTHKYLRPDLQWTTNVDEAINFEFALNAIRHGVNELKQPFVMFFKFHQPELDFTSDAYAREVPQATEVLNTIAARQGRQIAA